MRFIQELLDKKESDISITLPDGGDKAALEKWAKEHGATVINRYSLDTLFSTAKDYGISFSEKVDKDELDRLIKELQKDGYEAAKTKD